MSYINIIAVLGYVVSFATGPGKVSCIIKHLERIIMSLIEGHTLSRSLLSLYIYAEILNM